MAAAQFFMSPGTHRPTKTVRRIDTRNEKLAALGRETRAPVADYCPCAVASRVVSILRDFGQGDNLRVKNSGHMIMMKRTLTTIVSASLMAAAALAQDKKPVQIIAPAKNEPKAAEAPVDKKDISYAVGMNLGNNWKQSNFDFDVDEVAKAIKDVMTGGATRLTETQAQAAIQKWRTEHQAKQEAKRKEDGEKSKKEGAAFLEKNATKPDVKKTASGLQYKVIKEGTGKMPKSSDKVKVHYLGKLINGVSFDSSYSRNQPAEFPVTGVIKGWTEALQLMKVGSKWELYIPSDLAYGEMGQRSIPPNSVLIFEVELLDIMSPPEDSVNAVSGEIIKVPSAEELKKGAKIEVLKEEDVKRLQNQKAAPANNQKPPGK